MSGMSLMKALDTHDRQETARILQTMPSEVSIRDSEDRVALHYAAETMDLEMFERIYKEDSTLLDSQDKNGHTPLLMAVMGGRTDLVEFLLSKGANINHVDRDGHSLVHWAVVCGQLDTLTLLISKGADVTVPDLMNASPLHYSTAAEELSSDLCLSILHTLLRAGADPNGRDKDERTPIIWSASNGNLEAMTSLREAGGELWAVDRDRLAVLHCAASHGFHEVIDYFLESSPRSMVDLKDRSGHSPLFYAVSFGHYEAARKLLDYGANPNHQDYRLRTPAHCAAARGQMRMLKLLKQYAASFEVQNYRGDLPVHEAVQAGSKDLVEWLLALHPSTLDAANHTGRTSLHLAAAIGNIEMVILLCTQGCFVDPLMLYNEVLYTPLDLAKKKKHQVVVEYLTMRHHAKESSELDEETKKSSKVTFEEQVVQGKLARGKHLQRSESITAMESKNRKERRRSSDMSSERYDVKNAAVNTSARRVSSANGSRPLIGKSTSTSDLPKVGEDSSTTTQKIKEIIREEMEEMDRERGQEAEQRKVSKGSAAAPTLRGDSVELSEIEDGSGDELREDEFEDLPGISDSSDGEFDVPKENHGPTGSILKRSKSEERPKAANSKSNSRVTSAAKTATSSEEKSSEKSGPSKGEGTGEEVKALRIKRKMKAPPGAKVMMSVLRQPEMGEGAGELDIYEDDWERIQGHDRPVGKDAARRYVHEKALFQELTHLKRMQIQYGKVQEKILVRSLIGNFCKMHGLDPVNFKFQTFYAWEKFLYDQLKTIYLEERSRLAHASHARGGGGNRRLDRFETRLRQARAIPLNDKVSRMSQVYGSSTMTTGKSAVRSRTADNKRNSTLVCGQGSKRCDCLGKHILIKEK